MDLRHGHDRESSCGNLISRILVLAVSYVHCTSRLLTKIDWWYFLPSFKERNRLLSITAFKKWSDSWLFLIFRTKNQLKHLDFNHFPDVFSSIIHQNTLSTPCLTNAQETGLLRLFRPVIPIVPVWSPGPIVSRHLMQFPDTSPYSIFYKCLHDHPCLWALAKRLLDLD